MLDDKRVKKIVKQVRKTPIFLANNSGNFLCEHKYALNFPYLHQCMFNAKNVNLFNVLENL